MQKLKEKMNKEVDTLALIGNLEEALSNKEFADFVSNIKLSKEELSKYTSLLLESFTEYSNCLKCKNILTCKNKVEGCAYLPKIVNNKIVFYYKSCKYRNKLKETTEYLKNITLVKVPKSLMEAKMKDIYLNDENRFDTIKWLKEFINNYSKNNDVKGLYLNGNFGSGKSYLIAAMFNELAKCNYKSAIVFWPEFIRNIKSFEDFNVEFEKIKRSPLLLIDDIGAENLTTWARDEILCPLLQYRMDEKLATFFTSNLSFNELEEHLSFTKSGVDKVKAKRIIERIKQLTIPMTMVSQNLRK